MDRFPMCASNYSHSFAIGVEVGMAEELPGVNGCFDVAFRQQGQTIAGVSEAPLEETMVDPDLWAKGSAGTCRNES